MTGAGVHLTALALELPDRYLRTSDVDGAWRARDVDDGGTGPAVVGADEDVVTMAVAAAMRLGLEEAPDALVVVTPAPPRRRYSAAAVVAAALGLPRSTPLTDVGGTHAAGVTALRDAALAVRAGLGEVLVVVADAPVAPPGEGGEGRWGHGAFAALVSTRPGVAELLGFATASDPAPQWFDDARGVVQDAGERLIALSELPGLASDASARVLGAAGVAGAEVDAVAVSLPSPRLASRLAGSLTPGADVDAVGAKAWGDGFSGAAMVGPLLAALADEGGAGSTVLLAAAGGGIEVALLRVGEVEPLPPGERVRRPLPYAEHLRRRGLLDRPIPQPDASAVAAWREQDALLRLHGERCPDCSTVRFPLGGACPGCGSTAEGEHERLVGDAVVVTATRDHLVALVNPGTPENPTTMAVLETPVGARLYLPVVDGLDVEVGDRVRTVFRLSHDGGGWPNYHWKAAPAGGSGPDGVGGDAS